MTARVQPRLAWGPLRRATGSSNTCQAARALGIHVRVAQRYSTTGVPLSQADRLAAAAGAHPFDVWGNEYVRLEERADRFRALRASMEYRRRHDRICARDGIENHSWDSIERSHRQWQNQRQRFEYDRLDREADRLAEGEAA